MFQALLPEVSGNEYSAVLFAGMIFNFFVCLVSIAAMRWIRNPKMAISILLGLVIGNALLVGQLEPAKLERSADIVFQAVKNNTVTEKPYFFDSSKVVLSAYNAVNERTETIIVSKETLAELRSGGVYDAK